MTADLQRSSSLRDLDGDVLEMVNFRSMSGIVCTENLNPGIVVMESAEDGERFDASGPLNRTRDRRIFVQ